MLIPKMTFATNSKIRNGVADPNQILVQTSYLVVSLMLERATTKDRQVLHNGFAVALAYFCTHLVGSLAYKVTMRYSYSCTARSTQFLQLLYHRGWKLCKQMLGRSKVYKLGDHDFGPQHCDRVCCFNGPGNMLLSQRAAHQKGTSLVCSASTVK